MTVSTELDAENFVDVDIWSEGFRQNWVDYAAEWATRDPFYLLKDGTPWVVVSRHAHVSEVFRDSERFSTTLPERPAGWFDPFMGLPHLAIMSGDNHDRVKRAVQPWIGPRAVKQFADSIDSHVNALIDELEQQDGPVDLVEGFGHQLIPRIMLGDIFNLADEDRATFVRMNDLLGGLSIHGGAFDEYIECLDQCREIVGRMIAEREAEPSPSDFIGALVEARRVGTAPMTDEEILGTVLSFSTASITSTGSRTSMLLYQWLQHKDEFERLREHPELVPSAIEESMRLHHSIFLFPRYATEDTTVGGTFIRQGMPVTLLVAAADLDPDVFPDPLAFKVDRDPKNTTSFGMGQHYCVGAVLARRIIAKSLTTFMDRHPGATLTDPDARILLVGQPGMTAPAEILIDLN